MNEKSSANEKHSQRRRGIDKRANLSRDLISKYRRLFVDPHTRGKSVADLVEAASRQPAPCYYVTPEYAAKRVSMFRRRGYEGVSRRTELKWREIELRARRYQERYGLCLIRAVEMVIDSPASSFFIKPNTATRIYYNQRGKRRSAADSSNPKQSKQ